MVRMLGVGMTDEDAVWGLEGLAGVFSTPVRPVQALTVEPGVALNPDFCLNSSQWS